MIEKEFVLVSQGIEIYRTKSQEQAVNMVKEYNDEYFDYQQKCYDNYERPADNYVDLEIEYSNEKEKDKEIERLNNIINELEEEYINYMDKQDFAKKCKISRPYLDKLLKVMNRREIYEFCKQRNKIKELKGSGKE